MTVNPRIGALHIDHTWLGAAQAVIVAADADIHPVAGNGSGNQKAASDILVLSAPDNLAVGASAGGPERNTLTDLNQRRIAFGGLHLLDASTAADVAVVADADLVTAIDFAATGVDLDISGAGRTVNANAPVAL